jgi:hypothetical protein
LKSIIKSLHRKARKKASFIFICHPELVSGSLLYGSKTKGRHEVSKAQRESKAKAFTAKHAKLSQNESQERKAKQKLSTTEHIEQACFL